MFKEIKLPKLYSDNKYLLFELLIINLFGSFSFFLFEPLKDYLSNMDDYWFDFKEYVGLILLAMGIVFLFCSIVFFLLSAISPKIADILISIEFFLILGLYVQSNLVPNTNGALDGTAIDWSKINVDMIVSDIWWVLFFAVAVLTFRKVSKEKRGKWSVFISLAVLLMEMITIAYLLIINSPFSDKYEKYFMSDSEEMDLSQKENFIILLVDCFDSTYFNEAIPDELISELSGFTYYPDTTSMYGHTLCSLSQLLTGEPFVNQMAYEEYERESFDNSHLLQVLNKDGWNVGIYSDYEFPMVKALSETTNLIDSSYQISSLKNFYRIIYRIVGYSVAPYHLKKAIWFYPQLSDLKENPLDEEYGVYTTNNEMFYKKMDSLTAAKDVPVFRFFHIEGMHTPYMTDENVLTCEDEVSFEQSREACYRIILKFVEQLKAQNAYDNSALIIMADHGGFDRIGGLKQNPLFMGKGIGESHDFRVSNQKITYENIMTIYDNIMGGKTGADIIGNDTVETRVFYEYGYDTMDQMKRHEIKGKAWDVIYE